MKKSIGIIVGSLRRDSFSKAIARNILNLLPDDFHGEMIEIGHLPLFNQDYDDDGNTPDSYILFRQKIKEMDGFLFVTPEYNRSYPAVIKNALDIASRPYGQNAWNEKPGAIVSVSPGRLSAFGANHHLRQVMVFLNIYMMQQPEAYIGNVDAMLGKDGVVNDDKSQQFLQSIVDAFGIWVKRFN